MHGCLNVLSNILQPKTVPPGIWEWVPDTWNNVYIGSLGIIVLGKLDDAVDLGMEGVILSVVNLN